MMKAAKKNPGDPWRQELTTFCDGLIGPSEIYFPIRHHSPACALHLARLINSQQPASILIEGPDSLNGYIPDLANPKLIAPVALYSQYVDRKGLTLRNTEKPESAKMPPPRFGMYYPLCDYSPELVAIREGHRVGARVAFCDLDYARQVVLVRRIEDDDQRTGSLLDERHFARSRYLRELAMRSGCRDTNELWDRLFESSFGQLDTKAFMRRVATYCFLARIDAPEDELRSDGTLAREACMWDHIQSERNRLRRRKEKRPLLVVTGGFHTPPLVLKQVDTTAERLLNADINENDVLHAIIPYSFEQLDAMNGYAAGMPSPSYYQRLWDTVAKQGKVDLEEVSRSFLVELPQRTREAGLAQPLSTADAIAAYQQACTLARFRGNPGPMREDMLDGVRSSFVKGSLDAEGEVVLALARALLCGDSVGSLPKGMRTHPLLEDFQACARQLGLALDSTTLRTTELAIYEKDKHRQISGFFRRLQFLNVPYARFVGGPDFVSGVNLGLRIEHWEYAWSPHTDSALVELAPKGTTILEAILTTLHERQAEIEAAGAGEGSVEAVALLLVSCRIGLQDQAHAFVPFVFERIQLDSSFESSVQAATQLNQLCHFKSPLETGTLEALPKILEAAYARACYLLNSFTTVPGDRVPGMLRGLVALRELINTGENAQLLDPDLLLDAASSAGSHQGLDPSLAGGMFGVLFTAGKRSRKDLLAMIEAQRDSRDSKGNSLGRFLVGLFALCRELTWNNEALMESIHQCMASWSDDEFYRCLPDLRLAFAQHTPQETNRAAALIARISDTGGESFPARINWYNRSVDETLVARCTRAAARVAESMKRDHLETF